MREARMVTSRRAARKAIQCREPARVLRIVVRVPLRSFRATLRSCLLAREQGEAQQRQAIRSPRSHHGQL